MFKVRREGASELWLIGDKTDWWHRTNPDPVQLTSGPMAYYYPLPSRDGKQIFAVGSLPTGEAVRYDATAKDFVPFWGGRSIEFLNSSPDRKWITYVAFPEGTLWRARVDGTEALQLTYPSLGGVWLPHWSPDGKWIVFTARQVGKPCIAYIISAEGGSARSFPMPLPQAYADWMPNGDALIYGTDNDSGDDLVLYRLDLKTEQATKIPGTEGLFWPIWSHDGRLAALDASLRLFLIDLPSGKRHELASWAFLPAWSPDSHFIYFWVDRAIRRVRVTDGKVERVVDSTFRVASMSINLVADNSLVLLREHGHFDVYAFSLSWR